MEIRELIFKLCAIPSVSGFEKRGTQALDALVDGQLERVFVDGVGNHVYKKSCGKEGAPRLLIDAHFDEIGMIVTDIAEGGFLRVAPMGGIDPSILSAADVIIYGKQTLRGVICSTPPHLKKDEKLVRPDQMLVDTGLSEERAKELIEIGTPVGFAPVYGELLGERLIGKSFDDKAPAACALWTVINTPAQKLAADVYVLLSSVEETNRLGGVSAATYAIDPDYAMVIDVNLARVPDTKDFETVEMDKGISVSISPATHYGLTIATMELCREKEIDFCAVAAPSGTGTNAPSVNLTLCGVPVVDIGLPLASMHTYNEVISMKDCRTLCKLIEEFITSEKLACEFGREEVEWI